MPESTALQVMQSKKSCSSSSSTSTSTSSKRFKLFSRFVSKEEKPVGDHHDAIEDLSKLKLRNKMYSDSVRSNATIQTVTSSASLDHLLGDETTSATEAAEDTDFSSSSVSIIKVSSVCSTTQAESLCSNGDVVEEIEEEEEEEHRILEEDDEDEEESPSTRTVVPKEAEELIATISAAIQLGGELSAQGDYAASREQYELALRSAHICANDLYTMNKKQQQQQPNRKTTTAHVCANVWYTIGLLNVKLQEYSDAVYAYEQELMYTVQYTKQRTNPTGESNVTAYSEFQRVLKALAVAKCHTGLGRLHQYDMGETEKALPYYQRALRVEEQVYQTIKAYMKHNTIQCTECSIETIKDTTTPDKQRKKPLLSKLKKKKKTSCCCPHVQNELQELVSQIQDTKRSIGRIHFQNGHVDQALRFAIHGKQQQ